MAAVLEYDFKVVGRAAVEREIASLERRFIQSANKLNSQFDRVGGRSSGSSAFKSKSMLASSGREQVAQIKKTENAAVKAVREERKQVESLNRSRQSIHNQRIREQRQQSAEQQRSIDRQSKSQQSLARQRAREERESVSIGRRRSAIAQSIIAPGVGRVASVIGSVGKAGMAVAGLGAGALGASAISQAIGLDEQARRTAIAGRQAGEKLVDSDNLMKSYYRTGIKYGLAPEDVAAGTRKYVTKTGNIREGMRQQNFFAEVAQGEQSSVEDIAGMSADMEMLGVKSDADKKRAMAIFTAQGKLGKFELKDVASEAPEALSTAAMAGVRGVQGIRDVGSLLQMAQQATNSKSEAGTAVRSLYMDMFKHADKIQSGKVFGGKGVNVYEGGDFKKGMRAMPDVILDMLSASRGNMSDLLEASNIRGVKAIAPAQAAYQEAYKNAKGSDKDKNVAGLEAAKGAIGKFQNVSEDYGEIQKDAADAMKSFSVQLELFQTKLKEAIASQLFPALAELLPHVTALVPQVSRLVKSFLAVASWMANNPLKGLGAAVIASLLYEFSKARISTILKNGMDALFKPGGGGGGGGEGGSGISIPSKGGYTGTGFGASKGGSLSGALSAGGTGLALGLTVASAIFTVGVGKFEMGEASMAAGGSDLNTVRNSTTADIEAVKKKIAEQHDRLRNSQPDLIDKGLDLFGMSNKKTETNTQEAYLVEMQNKLVELQTQAAKDMIIAAAAQKEAAAAQSGKKPNTGDGPTSIKDK